MTPYLPPEILLRIASCCLESFSDQELWFSLARVSRLFRHETTKFIIGSHALSAQTPLCTRLEQESHLQSNGCQVNCSDFRCSDDHERLYRLNFRGFSEDDADLVTFECTWGSVSPNLAEQADRIRSTSDGNPERITFDVGIIEPSNGYSGSWTTSTADVGAPVRVETIQSTRWSGKLVIFFEWRKLWTLKCAPQRKLENLRKQVQEEGLNQDQQTEKDAAERARAARKATLKAYSEKFAKRKRTAAN